MPLQLQQQEIMPQNENHRVAFYRDNTKMGKFKNS